MSGEALLKAMFKPLAEHIAAEMGASAETIQFCETMRAQFPGHFSEFLWTEIKNALIQLQEEASP